MWATILPPTEMRLFKAEPLVDREIFSVTWSPERQQFLPEVRNCYKDSGKMIGRIYKSHVRFACEHMGVHVCVQMCGCTYAHQLRHMDDVPRSLQARWDVTDSLSCHRPWT